MTVVVDLWKFVGADLHNPEKSATVYEMGIMGSALTIMGTTKQFDRFAELIRRQMEEKEK